MPRGLTTAAATAIAGEVVHRTVAVDLDFPSGHVRFNGSPIDLTIGGNTYLGIGGLGGITAVEEASEMRSYDLSVQLSGIPRDSIALALTEAYQGRAGVIYEVPLDPDTGLPVPDPFVVFRGRMDMMDIRIGDTATVTVKLLNRLGDWERARVRRYTDEDQQRVHPGDFGLAYVASTVEKELIWPLRGWWDSH